MSADPAPLIAASGLVLKAFPDATPFDIAIAPGQHRLVVSEPEAGKTSLAKTLLGVISPRAGRVWLSGDDLDSLTPARLLEARRRFGVVYAADGLIPAWTGFDNLALPLRLAGIADGHEIGARLAAWVERYRIPAHWLDLSCSRLERDARLTLALSRALIGNPSLLLLDGVPLDLAIGYSPRHGLAMLRDFVASGGAMLVLVRETFAERVPEQAIGASFHRLRLVAGGLQSVDDCAAGQVTATGNQAQPSDGSS